MEIKKVGSRCTMFTYYDLGIPTNVCVIEGKHNVYILDTYLGPEVMKEINEYIENNFGNKNMIVINSHSHWDHVWGNSIYASSIIIGHVKCREIMQQEGQMAYEEYKHLKKGDIVLTYPNLTFTNKLYFEEDELLLYHSPGHTEDEISIVDKRDKILYVGDNLERPIPYLMAKDLDQYVRTMEEYLNLDVDIILGGHTVCEGKNLVRDNMYYVKKVIEGNTKEFETGVYEDYHTTNMKWLEEHV